ncbi:MAG TPA: carboxypeptidase-like regulatory domain-containing protein, partial [Blastocatellia bacterium]|nr:carboxypeptidase-like regulatory domain-containing protein [Blastocatellia bacterium]
EPILDARELGRDWQTGRPDSPWRSLPPLKAGDGVTAVAGQVLTLTGVPLARVTLQIGDVKTESDETGRFLLAGLPNGHQELLIDGTSANRRRKTYGVFEAGIEVRQGETNVLRFTIWMPRLDTASEITILSPTKTEIVLTTSAHSRTRGPHTTEHGHSGSKRRTRHSNRNNADPGRPPAVPAAKKR